jgi:hypothetical protein
MKPTERSMYCDFNQGHKLGKEKAPDIAGIRASALTSHLRRACQQRMRGLVFPESLQG